ncbi:TPA: acyltransferase [Staphylococcus aureus]|nr:acyltransferase [Staphylococcus aureus]HDA7354030.1 acyltransferase [Staphylococcus aureus]HDA7381929.1 acyltransferase [Staphylococcus aureus]HDA7401461.1 acyltransferase [Staphylococcus aureus]HDA7450897.1 acyltransferase [Staphylococcus aureus]
MMLLEGDEPEEDAEKRQGDEDDVSEGHGAAFARARGVVSVQLLRNVVLRSPNRTYNLEADELRGGAALLVFFYHSISSGAPSVGAVTGRLTSENPFATLVYEGHTGVALFMVLSGYILASGTFDRDISYRGFLKNRMLRIFPLMFVVLVFSLYTAKSVDLGSVAAPFLLLANLPIAISSPSNLSGTVWTISVEFQFYLIAPFLFLFAGRYGLARFLLPAMLLFWLLKIIALLPLAPAEQYRANYYTIVGRIDQFMIGIALAYLIHIRKFSIVANRTLGVCFLAASSLGVLALTWIVNQQGGLPAFRWWHLAYPEIEALLWAAFIAGYLAATPLRRTRVSAAFRWIGTLSFSIYILHYAVQYEFWTAIRLGYLGSVQTGMLGVFVLSFGVLVAVLLLSTLSYHCIEKPFLEMREKYLDRQGRADVTSIAA